MTISEKCKEQRGQREIVNLLKDEGFSASRNLQQTRDGGHDLIIEGHSVAVECKRAAKPLINQWWQQCERQARQAGLTPVLVYKLDRKPIRAIMPLQMIDSSHDERYLCEVDFATFAYLLRECAA